MDYAITRQNYQRIAQQKNIYLCIVGGSLLLNILQITERMTCNEKIIVTPPSIQKDFWIKGNAVSKEYLEEWALYLTNLLLTVSPNSISYQFELALKHISPDYSAKMQTQFKHDADALKKNNASTVFTPKEISVNEKEMTVQVSGMLATYVGKQQVSVHEHTYQVQFVFNQGRFLQLTHFKQTSIDRKKHEEDTAQPLSHNR